ncbi:glyoxalase/bleomycin resistance/extradiol dioxygenase family protein [Streptomyces tanashiensis]
MDVPYPRLLVSRFADSFRFYAAVLPPLSGAVLDKGAPDGPYAGWEVAAGPPWCSSTAPRWPRSSAPGPSRTGRPGHRDLVLRVADVDEALALCLESGRPRARRGRPPEWGPGLRTAHLRDPEGHLIEPLQSYS